MKDSWGVDAAEVAYFTPSACHVSASEKAVFPLSNGGIFIEWMNLMFLSLLWPTGSLESNFSSSLPYGYNHHS